MSAHFDGWRRAGFKVLTTLHPKDGWGVTGYVNNDQAPGLGVNQASSRRWAVTHLASGLVVGARFNSLPRAKQAALAFAAFGDWTRDYQTVFADLALKSKVAEWLGLKVPV